MYIINHHIIFQYYQDVLTDVERLIYADTDLRFLVPLEEVWSLFDMFNTVQIAGLTWHNEDGRAPTYVQEKLNFPLFKPYGQFYRAIRVYI